jgi:hypothetical protein
LATWQVAGIGADHSADIQISVKDYVRNNWSLTGDLAAARIVFSTGWYDKSRQYQIHFRHDTFPKKSRYTIGHDPYYRYDDFIQVHVWVTQKQNNQEPSQLGKIAREIDRIISVGITGLMVTQGFQIMEFIRPINTLPQEDSQNSIWHAQGVLGILYHKVNV